MKTSDSKIAYLRTITTVGFVFLLCPASFAWYWGNLAVYVTSYLKATDTSYDTSSAIIWIHSLFWALFTLGMLGLDYLASLIGHGWTLLIGIFLCDLGIALGYYTVQHSVATTCITMGAMTGTGSGILVAEAIVYVSMWKTKYKGLFIGVVTSGTIVGTIPAEQFFTRNINPDNKAPDLVLGQESFFTQPEIIERVPTTLLLFGGICFGWQLISFLFTEYVRRKHILLEELLHNDEHVSMTSLQQGTSSNDVNEHENDVKMLLNEGIINGQTKNEFVSQTNSLTEKDRISGYVSDLSSNISSQKTTTTCKTESSQNGDERTQLTLFNCHNTGNQYHQHQEPSHTTQSREAQLDVDRQIVNFTSLQMVKSASFYVLLGCFIAGSFSYALINNYYKIYGLRWIENDHFISDADVITCLTAAVARLGFGAMVDFFGVKYTLTLFHAFLTIIPQIWYFTPMVDKWLYIIVTTMYRAVTTGIYVVFAAATLCLFGQQYFAKKYGLLLVCSIFADLVHPTVMSSVLEGFGWFALFLTGSLVNFVILLSVVIVLPRV